MSEKLFNYCERGADPSFWAEPMNALTNLAFLAAAGLSAYELGKRQRSERSPDHFLLIGLVFCIAIGSFLFHTFAEPWSALADIVPIAVFMLVYMAVALNSFLRLPPGLTFVLTLAFAALIALFMQIKCGGGVGGLGQSGAGQACLNGSLGYVPALLAMLAVGWLLRRRAHPAAPLILAAGATFLVSLAFRTIDFSVCREFSIGSYSLGTHFLWHCLNAVTLYLLVRAAINYAQHGVMIQEIITPIRRVRSKMDSDHPKSH